MRHTAVQGPNPGTAVSRPLCDSQHTTPPPAATGGDRWLVVVDSCGPVATAVGTRPVPFRTRKLSPPAPMVLHPGGCGRVGHRRTHTTPQEKGPKKGALFFNQNTAMRAAAAKPGTSLLRLGRCVGVLING